MNVQQKREIDSRNQDRERQYAEEQFLARHARERLDELIARDAQEEMIRRVRAEACAAEYGRKLK